MKRSTLALTALTIVLGAQSIRVFLPALILHIGEGPVNPAVFALYAYGPFGLALAGPLSSSRAWSGLVRRSGSP